jgi:uncharacterized caspase-like protein
VRIAVQEGAPDAAQAKGSGVRDLRLFRNGQLVKAWRGTLKPEADGKVRVEADLAAAAGENRFTAYAFNLDNIRSHNALAVVNKPGAAKGGITYVLAIGVNQYENRDFALRYAVADAETMAAKLEQRQREAGMAVRTAVLRDQDATAGNIRLAFARLAGAQLPAAAPAALKALEPARPEDNVVLFFGGHGVAVGDRFYLVPHDLGYRGPWEQLHANLQTILDHSISDEELERLLEPIDARHMALIIDACQSGQALESEEERRGPMNSRGLAQLAWEKGVSILAASQAYQAAIESSGLEHGYLTYALAEGLDKPVADAEPVDGVISDREWLNYAVKRVPELQIVAMGKAKKEGRSLTLEPALMGTASSRLQTPRLFTPREASEEVWVIAKFAERGR